VSAAQDHLEAARDRVRSGDRASPDRRRIRNLAWILGSVALAFYVGFIALSIYRGHR
jgi:hypothetical protein